MVEADVHVHRRRVEVRHEKVLRPSSRLWEKWRVLPRHSPRLELADVLSAIEPDTVVMLDLKCFTVAAARRIHDAVPPERHLIVSSRSWWTLGPFHDRPRTRVLRSCANRAQRWWGTRLPGLGPTVGTTLHERLLTPAVAARVRRRTPHLYAWGAQTSERCVALVMMGVTGLTLDDPSLADLI